MCSVLFALSLTCTAALFCINLTRLLCTDQFEETAAATLSLTVGTSARSTNECAYLQEAMDMLDALLLRGSHDEGGCLRLSGDDWAAS